MAPFPSDQLPERSPERRRSGCTARVDTGLSMTVCLHIPLGTKERCAKGLCWHPVTENDRRDRSLGVARCGCASDGRRGYAAVSCQLWNLNTQDFVHHNFTQSY